MKADIITKNVWLKLASLGLAVVLWFFVILSARSGISFDIPVMYINIPQDLDLADIPKSVSVTVEGQERILKRLKSSDIDAVVDLHEAKEGKNYYALTSENFTLPETLEITSIEPQMLALTLEKHFKKTVPVQPSILGVPAPGYAIFDIRVVPGELALEGAKEAVSRIVNVKTEPIEISGVNSDIRYKAKLELPNSGVRSGVQKVDVYILVRKKH